MVQVTETKTFTLKGWTGGLNSEDPEHLHLPEEYGGQNMVFSPSGAATPRKGLTLTSAHASWQAAPYNLPIVRIFPYSPNSGISWYMIGVDSGGRVWRSPPAVVGTMVPCNAGALNQVTFSTELAGTALHDSAILGNYFVLVSEDDQPAFWSGSAGDTWGRITDNVLDDSGTEAAWEFPICSTVCSAFSRMWAAGNDTNPSRLFWSGAVGTVKEGTEVPAGPWSWPATNWVDVNPEDGSSITKIVPFGQAIIIFKESSVYAFIGAGDPATARLYLLHGSVGCSHPHTAAVISDRVFWATREGVWSYDGTTIGRIDAKVRTELQAFLDGTLTGACAVQGRYHIVNTYGRFSYDWEHDRWEKHTDGSDGIAVIENVVYVCRWGGIFLSENADGFDEVYSMGGVLSNVAPAAYLYTSWLPPPDQKTGSKYRLRRLDLYLDRPSLAPGTDGYYEVRLWTDYNGVAHVHNWHISLDHASTVVGPFQLTLPGWGLLMDSFRISIQSSADEITGQCDRLTVNSVAFVLSERPTKRSAPWPTGTAGG